jgi:3-hydroxyisobutyrate dehydrogenase
MAVIGFIGLGNMGLPMAKNLLKAGHQLQVFDLASAAVEAAVAAGATAAGSVAKAATGAEVVITMLPEGRHVRAVYEGEDGVVARAAEGALLIDCSTIDVATARAMSRLAEEQRGLELIDAPVSGGTAGAENGTLTFMVGGSEAGLEGARPLLEAMGRTIVHTGGSGNGQAAKICNNMMLAISMIGTAEAFTMAERLGVEPQKLFDIVSTSSGQCWALTSYCPVPGPVPAAPSNRDFKPGFTTAMMAKDLRLAQNAAVESGSPSPLGAQAQNLYALFESQGHGALDFSAIIKMISAKT